MIGENFINFLQSECEIYYCNKDKVYFVLDGRRRTTLVSGLIEMLYSYFKHIGGESIC